MKTLSIREMRAALGQAIARALPAKPQRAMPSHAEHRSRMPRLSPSAELIREDRDAR